MEYFIFLSIAVVCTGAGFLAGYAIARQREQPEEKEALPQEAPTPEYPPDALHIWRDPDAAQLVIRIGGREFHSMEPFPPQEQKFMLQLLTYLQKWVGAPSAESSPKAGVPTPPPAPATKKQPSDVSPFAPEPSEISTAPKSIVEQIDDILQDKLTTSPLKDRGIRLMQTLQGGMLVLVGLDQYDDIEAIPDEEVIQIIRAAVKEWEQQQ